VARLVGGEGVEMFAVIAVSSPSIPSVPEELARKSSAWPPGYALIVQACEYRP
jgi:hypothetical protein